MKNLRGVFRGMWRPILIVISAGLILYMVLFSQLGSLVPGIHISEAEAYQSSLNLQSIIENPVNAPHKLLQLSLMKVGEVGALWLRATSAIFGVLSVVLFFYLLQRWHTTRVAFLGTVLFATSSSVLHTARLGTPDILLLLGVLGLLALGVRLERERPGSTGLLLTSGVFGILIYVPGFIWLILAGLIWKRRKVSNIISRVPWLSRIGIAILLIILLAPLGYAVYRDLGVFREILGLPAEFLTPIEMLKNLIKAPLSFFIFSPENPVRSLGRLPLLDVFSTAMFALGVYAHWFTRRSERTQFLLGSFVFGTILVALGGSVGIAVLVPSVYVVTAAGITLLLQQWFTVFPRNPLARGVGITMITAAVLVASMYHFNRYFVAWSNTPETRQVFTESLNQVQ